MKIEKKLHIIFVLSLIFFGLLVLAINSQSAIQYTSEDDNGDELLPQNI